MMIKLNKKNWKEYSFNDVAIQQKEAVDRENTTLDKYVAGKHMLTEDIHIRQWGIVGDDYLGPAFHRKFCKNDILYGSRRTYLKKVSVAHFDGITANTTFVIRSNDKIITPRLLPFLMLSDSFTEHSVKNSKGSVNPYINWKDIANYELRLPPLDEQKRLADLLWSVDEVIEGWRKIENSLKNLYSRFGQDVFLSQKSHKEQLSNVAQINMGQSPPGSAYNEKGEGTPFLQGNAEFGDIFPKYVKSTRIVTKTANSGDILLSVRAPVGAINIADREYCIGRGLAAISINNRELYEYLKHALIFLKPEMDRTSTGSTFKAINKKAVESLKIPFMGKNNMVVLGEELEKISNDIKQIQYHIQIIKEIQKQIINQIFGGKP